MRISDWSSDVCSSDLAKVVSISSVQSAASSLPALSLSLAFLLFAPELTGSLDTYRFAHKGESAPTPIALVLRRACKGQGSCNACNTTSPWSSACNIGCSTSRRCSTNWPPFSSSASAVDNAPTCSGTGSPSCATCNSPSAKRSTATLTGKTGIWKGSGDGSVSGPDRSEEHREGKGG